MRHPGEPRIKSGAGTGVQTLSPRRRGTIKENLDSRFHGKPWIPAFAGMTNFMEFRLFTRSSIKLLMKAKEEKGVKEEKRGIRKAIKKEKGKKSLTNGPQESTSIKQ
jgi:hypothetical protein